MLFTQRNSSNQRNSCFRDHNTTGRKVNPKIFCLFTLFLHCREVCLSALLSQPSPCPDTSHKEANIGSHLLFHCSVTANSSLLHFLLSYPPHVYPISFIIFWLTYTYHYSPFSPVSLKKCINPPTYSVSWPCHQTNIWENTCPFLFALWSNCQEKKDFFKKYRFSNYTLLFGRKLVPGVVIIHIKTIIRLKAAKLCSKGKNLKVRLCNSPEV